MYFSMCSLDLCLASLFLLSRQGMFLWHRKLWMWWKFSIITISVFTFRFAEERLLTGKEGGNQVWRGAPAGSQEGCAVGMAHLNHLTSQGVIITQILIPVHDSLSDLLPCKHSWSLAGCVHGFISGSPQAHPQVGAAPLHHLVISGQRWEFCSPSGPLQGGKQDISTDRKLRAPLGQHRDLLEAPHPALPTPLSLPKPLGGFGGVFLAPKTL